MTTLDWVIIVAYMLGMIGLSVYLGKGQKDEEDYYVGGRRLPWWAVGISTMATQTSAISFISIPAFVALRDGGGLPAPGSAKASSARRTLALQHPPFGASPPARSAWPRPICA